MASITAVFVYYDTGNKEIVDLNMHARCFLGKDVRCSFLNFYGVHTSRLHGPPIVVFAWLASVKERFHSFNVWYT